MFLVNLMCPENIAKTSSGVTEVDGCNTFAVCTSFVESIRGRTGSLICVTGSATIFCVAGKKLLHLLLLSSLLAFLECLANFFRHVVERGHDDVLIADLGSSHEVECLGLNLTRDSLQRNHQKV
jgi:hypothetical protein